jgi:hypothetical protein
MKLPKAFDLFIERSHALVVTVQTVYVCHETTCTLFGYLGHIVKEIHVLQTF